MPIFRCRAKLVYYAHVPKCAGSAVNRYLAQRFGAIAFQDERFLLRPSAERWSRTSAQHIDRQSLERLFPEGFFDAAFTIVRHPVPRIVSVYNFQREVERSIAPDMAFSQWLETLPAQVAVDPCVFDNHARPMDDIVPQGSEVFRLEDGMDGLIGWLDALAGAADGPRAIAPANQRSDRRPAGTEPVRPSADDLDVIESLYRRDFERFGYAIEAPRSMQDAPLGPAGERDARAQQGWLASLFGRS